MRRTIWTAGLVLLGATAVLFAAGCGNTAAVTTQPMEDSSLAPLGELYRMHTLMKKAPPKTMADFQEFEAGYPSVIKVIREGNVQVFWGGQLVNAEAVEPGASPSDTVLAFETKVPKEGGYVLMANRAVKKMTPEEFQSAPKAADKASGDGTAKDGR